MIEHELVYRGVRLTVSTDHDGPDAADAVARAFERMKRRVDLEHIKVELCGPLGRLMP